MNRVLRCALIAFMIAFSAMAKPEKAKPERSDPEKVRVEKHKIKADVKKQKANSKGGKPEVTETREFPLMFDIAEKAQRHKAKRLAKEAEKAAKEAEKEANEKKGKTTP